MDEKFISYIAFESTTSRQERTIKRLWILIILLIIALVGTNIGWIWVQSQYEYETEISQDIETDGNAQVTGVGAINVNENTSNYYTKEITQAKSQR